MKFFVVNGSSIEGTFPSLREAQDFIQSNFLESVWHELRIIKETNKREAMPFIGELVEQDIQKAFETEKHTTQI